MHGGTAGGGELRALQHHDPGTLAEHEPVAVDVEGPRRPLRLVVALGERAGLHEPGDGDAGDAGLGAAGDDDVDLAAAQQPQRPRQRLGAGRARRHRRVHAGLAPCTPGRSRPRGRSASASGTVSGETLRSPPVSSRSSWSSRVTAPPMPVPTTTASRSGSTSGDPACAQASLAATSATCSQRSSRRAWTRGRTSVGETASGAAIFTGRSYLSTKSNSSSMRRTPERPARTASQVEATSPPSGVVAPSPVTTTSMSGLVAPDVTGSSRCSRRRRPRS